MNERRFEYRSVSTWSSRALILSLSRFLRHWLLPACLPSAAISKSNDKCCCHIMTCHKFAFTSITHLSAPPSVAGNMAITNKCWLKFFCMAGSKTNSGIFTLSKSHSVKASKRQSRVFTYWSALKYLNGAAKLHLFYSERTPLSTELISRLVGSFSKICFMLI